MEVILFSIPCNFFLDTKVRKVHLTYIALNILNAQMITSAIVSLRTQNWKSLSIPDASVELKNETFFKVSGTLLDQPFSNRTAGNPVSVSP